MKKFLALFLAAFYILPLTVAAEEIGWEESFYTEKLSDAEVAEGIQKEETALSHKHTGAAPGAIPPELKTVDTRGGTIVEYDIEGEGHFDFSKPGIKYGSNRNVATLEYITLPGGDGCYKYNIAGNSPNSQSIYSDIGFRVKANHNYLISALMWIDYSRFAMDGSFREALINLHCEGLTQLSLRHGLTDYTGGQWQRIEYVASPGLMETNKARWILQTWGFQIGTPEESMYVADVTVVELPPVEVTPYKEGEGVTFRGGAGDLDMRVESAEETEDKIVVNTTGTRYTFDKKASTMLAEQKISKAREVSEWQSSVDFSDLSIRSQTENEVVITNSRVTFGVQLDGAVFLTPHGGDITMTVTSKIPGMWNRLNFGFLQAMDDYGGFTVTPDLPEGTGKRVNYEVLTEGLDFASWDFVNQLAPGASGRAHDFNTVISNVRAGWQIRWTMSPGERLAISTFPPREYDWEESFELTYQNRDATNSLAEYATDYENYDKRVATLFNFGDRSYANEWHGLFTFRANEERMHAHVEAAHAAGIKAIVYAPAYFYYNKETPDEFITEIKRIRDTYNLDGIYSDGLPSEHQWVTGYEESRMLRELFAGGALIAHQTGVPANGGGPLSAAAFSLPFVDTYWSATLKAETVYAEGLYPAIAKMTWSQRNVANCVGITKGDAWYILGEDGSRVSIPQLVKDLVALEFNGRARITARSADFRTQYVAELRMLKALWQQYGDDPDFYDKYYAPAVRAYNRPLLSAYDIQQLVVDADFADEDVKEDFAVYDTTMEKVDGRLKITGQPKAQRGSIFKRTQSVSGPMTIEYTINVEERGDFAQSFHTGYGQTAAGLLFGEDGKIKIRNIEGAYVNLMPFSRNTDYRVRLEIDTDAHTWSVYINDTLAAENLAMPETVYGVSELEMTDGGYGSVCYIDDVRVIDQI